MGVIVKINMANRKRLRVLPLACLLCVVLCPLISSMDSGKFASLMKQERCIGAKACACGLASGAFCCLVGCCVSDSIMCTLCAPCGACLAGYLCKWNLEEHIESRATRAARVYMRQLEQCSLASCSDAELYGQLRCVDACQCLLDAVGQRRQRVDWPQQLGVRQPNPPNLARAYERAQCDRQREYIQFHLSRRSDEGCCW